MKCYSDLLKKKKIKTMNNKMAVSTYLSTIESKKKQTKQTRKTDRIMGTESVVMVARCKGVQGNG